MQSNVVLETTSTVSLTVTFNGTMGAVTQIYTGSNGAYPQPSVPGMPQSVVVNGTQVNLGEMKSVEISGQMLDIAYIPFAPAGPNFTTLIIEAQGMGGY